MNIREEIIKSQQTVASLLVNPPPSDIIDPALYAERKPYVDKECQLITYMATRAVPIRFDIDDDNLLDVGYDFGRELLDIPEEGEDILIPIDPMMPYPLSLFYGQLLGGEGSHKHALLCGYVLSDGRDILAHPKESYDEARFVIVDLYKWPSGPIPWMVDSVSIRTDRSVRLITSPSEFYMMAREDTDELERVAARATQAINFMVACYGLLNMKHTIKQETDPPEKLNEARRKKGKIELTKSVVVKLDPRYVVHEGATRTHASPRPHWRRGHVRTMKSGKRVPVQPHMVMGEVPLPNEYVVKK